MGSENLRSLKQKIKVKLRVAQRKAAKELATLIPEIIKIKTRQEGQDFRGNPLRKLEDSTRAYRKRYKDNLHPDTNPDESNLTATGQMLDAIKGKAAGTKITVEVKNNKRRRELSGAKSDKTNKEVQREVEKAGREFLQLNNQDKEEILDVATDIIRQELSDVIK